MAPLNTKQKLVLQQIMWKRCITREEANSILSTLTINDDFDQFIRPINQQIGNLKMKIARGIDEATGNVHYAMVNIAETHLSRMCVQYSLEQQKALRCILEIIVKSPSGSFTLKELFAMLLDNETRFTRVQTQAFLQNLIEQRFLCVTGSDFSLDVRGCIELEPYFAQHYSNKVETCNACRVLCLRGIHCNSCSVKLHEPCLARSLQELGNKCPSCSNAWVARKVKTMVEQDTSPIQSAPNSDESF